MTVLEMTELPRYIAWADGFLPPAGNLEDIILPEFKDKLQMQPPQRDFAYLRTLETKMRTKYHSALGIGSGCADNDVHSDIYIIAPSHSPPPFPSKFTPIREELSHLGNRIDDYRLLCLVISEREPNELRDAFYDSLDELQFEIRSDNTYRDLPKFKNFLQELSREVVVVPYYAPSIRIEDDLISMGFAVESDTVV